MRACDAPRTVGSLMATSAVQQIPLGIWATAAAGISQGIVPRPSPP